MGPGAPIRNNHGIELSSRYEIRRVTPDLAESISALSFFTHYFDSPIWNAIYEGRQASEALKAYHACKPFYEMPEMAAKNGLSFCIWDKEFVFKRPESATKGGACYWNDFDIDDPNLEVNGRQRLLDALDFPIVGFGLSFDKFAPGDPKGWEAATKATPLNVPMGKHYEAHDPRPKGSWEPTATGQVIERVGSGTRHGYYGQGLMKALARFIMLEMKSRGYRAIQINCGAPQMHHVWSNPPKPFRSSTLVTFPTWIFEMEEDGKKVKPYEKSKLPNLYLVWTELLD
ncbi:hypothetical protein F4813DRAFT_210068 [Daldinia decipiens]|uniref:uncharacterized protein n=1 Tax=Daldinia decipiens TaxID=326647 RepID=UPI0020C58460|nr:uncharacterized protein F4813DRAFT_210068 [Daldinia decipiens]KAI1654483.1 hypothetical protein F4813DRAFT_210068 [Daldinia decipiens]